MSNPLDDPLLKDVIDRIRKLTPQKIAILREWLESHPAFYTIDDVARTLGVSWRTIRRYIDSGKIKAIKVGRQYRIPAEEFERITKEGVV